MSVKILVVDDEPDFTALIQIGFRKQIRQKVYEFVFARNGREALDQLDRHPDLDIMLCDLNMPVMDGLALLNILVDRNLPLKSIVVSAYGDMANIRAAMNGGAFDFVMKPIDMADLEKTIDKGVGEVRKEREAIQARQQLIETEKERDQVEEKAARLEALDELKSRLFTNISHEFRTPLTVILGMAEQMEEHPERWKPTGLSLIKRNAVSLLYLVNQLLDLRKLEAGKMELETSTGDLIGFTRYLAESFESLAERKDITLRFLPQEEHLWLQFDEQKIQQIFANLFSNALKFTPIGGEISCQIDWKKHPQKANLTILVQDNGPGIPEDQLTSIFRQFYQVKDLQPGSGTGIGLALTRELVQLMGGEISARNREDEPGAVFEIHLSLEVGEKNPQSLLPARPDYLPRGNPMELVEAEEESEELPELLIVEDNPDIQEYLIACLEGRYHLTLAGDGQAGIDKARAQIPDIIISDVRMPRKDGFELVETLKNDPGTNHIPIILLTARAHDEDRLEGLALGADAYLAKPFNKKELLIHLERLLDMSRALQQRYQTSGSKPSTENPIVRVQDDFIMKLKQIIEENLDNESFRIHEVCREIGLSRPQLHRKIKALTGLSASHFIRNFRLEKAQKLLLETDYSVSEIAYMVGFSSPNYFNRTFVALYQITPVKMRDNR